MKLEKRGRGIGKLSKLFKSIFFRRKISIITCENHALSKLPAPNQRNVRFEDEFFHDLLDSTVGAAYSDERCFTYAEVADLIRMDFAEFLCASADHSSVRAKGKALKAQQKGFQRVDKPSHSLSVLSAGAQEC
ncbi:hypothetical protein [Bacillus xiamenensis]|uniref:hypothetical protein n=1 Tax=Bacillus xiamenensis TaxID=1178537 RepID=UPI0012DD1667|nr:hypothetical protein [Bacillus xiamenensis]